MVERQNWEEKYKRARADYVNLERRVKKQLGELTRYTNEALIQNLLPIFDDLEKGLSLILKNFGEVLKSEGVEEIEVKIGDKFDPRLMEGVASEGSDGDVKVAEVLRKGYRMKEKILRPTQVKVKTM